MSETTYYPQVECEAESSTLNNTQIVTVTDATGVNQYLRVAAGFLTRAGDKEYLPVRVIEVERKTKRVLVELPYEAD